MRQIYWLGVTVVLTGILGLLALVLSPLAGFAAPGGEQHTSLEPEPIGYPAPALPPVPAFEDPLKQQIMAALEASTPPLTLGLNKTPGNGGDRPSGVVWQNLALRSGKAAPAGTPSKEATPFLLSSAINLTGRGSEQEKVAAQCSIEELFVAMEEARKMELAALEEVRKAKALKEQIGKQISDKMREIEKRLAGMKDS